MTAAGAVVALLALAAAGQDKPAGETVTKVADFEGGVPQGVRTHNIRVESVRSDAAAGVGSLLVRTADRTPGRRHVRIPLPPGVDVARHDRLICHIRVAERGGPVRLRWCAVDDENWIAFQRRFDVTPGEEWARVVLPLHLWRWGNLRAGDWSEVRSLVLQIESPVAAVELDEVGLVVGRRGRNSALPATQWYGKLAFGGRNSRSLERAGFLVATDAVHELAEQDLGEIIARMEKADRWVRRVLGGAVRPALAGQPVVLLIFRREREYRAFFQQLGREWRVSIPEPQTAGFTVQDISASTYEAKSGANRPVYFHELVHGVVARRLRLLTGVGAHSWFQEGLANYLQLCVYPKSLGRTVYVENFARPVAADGEGLFRPLETILTRRARSENYAQLASLVAYMAEENPALLRAVAIGLRKGASMKAILRAADTDFAALQKDWLAWGRKRFARDAAPPAGGETHFRTPREWRPEAELQ